MDADQKLNIETEFLKDHKQLMRGISSLLKVLQDDQWPEASKLADELDRQAGPHIEFEERVLYPAIARRRGEAYATQLFREHGIIRKALKKLCQPHALSEADRSEVVRSLKVGLRHSESCGSLFSYLGSLDSTARQRAARDLVRFRADSKRWTDL